MPLPTAQHKKYADKKIYADQQQSDALWADVVAANVQYLQAAVAFQCLCQLHIRRSMQTRRYMQTSSTLMPSGLMLLPPMSRTFRMLLPFSASANCLPEEVCAPEKARKSAAGGVVLEGKASLPG